MEDLVLLIQTLEIIKKQKEDSLKDAPGLTAYNRQLGEISGLETAINEAKLISMDE